MNILKTFKKPIYNIKKCMNILKTFKKSVLISLFFKKKKSSLY